MGDWSKPTTSSTYTNFVTELNDRLVDVAVAFDGRSLTSLPSGAIRFNSSTKVWEKWNGSAWGALDTNYAKTSGATFTGAVAFSNTVSVAPTGTAADLRLAAESGKDAWVTMSEGGYVAARLVHSAANDSFWVAMYDGSGANGRVQLKIDYNGATSLRFGDQQKLVTTTNGVSVTGTLLVDGVDVKAATTATKLATARTIGGVSFDGSANINLPGVNSSGNQNTSGNAATATKLATARTLSLTGAVTGSASFDGSANASIATTLANYEEGSFTPVIKGTTTAGAGTYTAQVGRYTKVGNVVHFWIALVWTAHTGTGSLYIDSLPFTPKNVSYMQRAVSVWAENLTFTGQLTGLVVTDQPLLNLWRVSSNAAAVQLAMDSTGSLFIAGSYEV